MPNAKPINRSDYGLPVSSSGIPGGLDLSEPLVPVCSKCGAKPVRIKGVLTIGLDSELRPVCKGGCK
jgi:hypothetical protein